MAKDSSFAARARSLGESAQVAGRRALSELSERALRLGGRAGAAGRSRTAASLNLAVLALGRANDDSQTAQARLGVELSNFELGIRLVAGKRYARALRPLETALALNQLNLIEGLGAATDVGDLLHLLGVANISSGRYLRATHCFGQEAEARQGEGDGKAEMIALANLISAQMHVAKDPHDEDAYRAAAQWSVKRHELAVELDDPEEEAEALEDRGYCLYKAGEEGEEVLDCLRQAVEAWDRLAAKGADVEHELTRTRILLGRCHNDRGEQVEALAPLRLAVESTRSFDDCGCRLQALRSICDALEALEDPIAGARYLREGAAYCKAIDSKYEVHFRSRLGTELAKQGDLEAGVREAEAAVLLGEAMCERDPAREQQLGEALNALGSTLNNHTQRLGDAADHTRRSIEIARRLGVDEDLARRLINLGIVLQNSRDLLLAIAALEEALEVCRELDAPAIEAEAHAQMGSARAKLGETLAAVRHYEAAADLYRGLGDHRRVSALLVSLGAVPDLPLRSAAGYLGKAASLSARIADGPAEAHALRELSRVRQAAGLEAEAVEYQRRGVAVIESARVRLDNTVDRVALLETHHDLYADAAFLAHKRGEDKRAFQHAEAGRARLTLDQRVGAAVGLIADPQTREQRRTLAAEIGNRARRLEELGMLWLEAERDGPEADTETAGSERGSPREEIELETARLDEEIEALEGEWKRLGSSLAASDPRFAARNAAGIDSVWTVPAIQDRLLDDDSVLLEYLIAEDGCLGFCVTREEFVAFDIPLGVDELTRLVDEMCKALDTSDGGYPHGHALYAALVGPVAALVDGKREVLICPDAALHCLPFGALLREDPDPGGKEAVPHYGNRWATLPYFLDGSTHIRYISSATTEALLREAERLDEPDYGGQLLALGAPLESAGESGSTSFPPLSYAPLELSRIVEMFAQERIDARPSPSGHPPATRSDALELLDRDPRGYRFVHLATHAFLDYRRPWLSGLVFEPEGADAADLSYLLANEAVDLQLPAECVTMSGCRTRGAEVAAGEGVIGLALAFRFAGARSVCASLWPVEDKSTAKLMERFYDGLRSREASPSAALAAAQRSLMAEACHPRHWAVFGLFG